MGRKRGFKNSGERRLLACSRRQLADDIPPSEMACCTSKPFRQAAEKNRLAACAPQKMTLALLFFTCRAAVMLDKQPACCCKGRGIVDLGIMTRLIFIVAVFVAGICTAVPRASAQVNVTQEHNNVSRDGVYIDAAFTPSAAANLTRDLGFNGTIVGNVYAQPLYIEGGPNGPMIIAVTESNNVYALDAVTGTVIWQRNLGTPVPLSQLFCGNIDPIGITGTPVVDLASRSLFLDALINGPTIKHFIYSLNVDTGVTNAGWPVDVNATANYNGMSFVSLIQEERGALALVNGIVYVY